MNSCGKLSRERSSLMCEFNSSKSFVLKFEQMRHEKWNVGLKSCSKGGSRVSGFKPWSISWLFDPLICCWKCCCWLFWACCCCWSIGRKLAGGVAPPCCKNWINNAWLYAMSASAAPGRCPVLVGSIPGIPRGVCGLCLRNDSICDWSRLILHWTTAKLCVCFSLVSCMR